MRVLLDECRPRALAAEFDAIEETTVPDAGRAGLRNGELLDVAAPAFDVLVTIDGSIEFQQNLAGRHIAVVALKATSNRLIDLAPLVPEVVALLSTVVRGRLYRVPVEQEPS